jgi:hypothetical protein
MMSDEEILRDGLRLPGKILVKLYFVPVTVWL